MKTPMDARRILFIGSSGYVKAVDRHTGEDLWQTSLPGTGYKTVTVLADGGWVYAGSKGYVFGLEATTGRIVWTNEMSGLGYEDMSLALQSGSAEPPPLPEEDDEEEENEGEDPEDNVQDADDDR